MIEDKELRDLFNAESEEHLEQLYNGLLSIEKKPDDPDILEELFRESHSLKGSARMLGISDIETISHRIEDILGDAFKGKSALTSEVIDRVYFALDAVKLLVKEEVAGEPANVNVLETLSVLSGESPVEKKSRLTKALDQEKKEPPSPDTPRETEIVDNSKPDAGERAGKAEPKVIAAEEANATSSRQTEIVALSKPDDSGSADIPSYKIDTIRVEPQKLDSLLTHAGELIVAKTRLSRRLNEIDQIISVYEELWGDFFDKRDVRNDYSSSLSKELLDDLGKMLGEMKSDLYEDNSRLGFISNELEEGIRKIRLLPLSTLFNLFPRMVRDMARERSKDIEIKIEGGETTADKLIIEELKDPLMHMIRNAVDHGIETSDERKKAGKEGGGVITLRALKTSTNIVIEVEDNGKGLDSNEIALLALQRGIVRQDEVDSMTKEQIYSMIFSPGFSTSEIITDLSGRGVGLDVVRTNVERLKGSIGVESERGKGCTIRIKLPLTLSTTRVFLVKTRERLFALSVEFVKTTKNVSKKDIFSIEGKGTLIIDERPVSVVWLSDLLELKGGVTESSLSNEEKSTNKADVVPCIVLSHGSEQVGILVDELLDELEIVIKPHNSILKRVRNISGSTILGTGEICMILNPPDLLKSVKKHEIPISPLEDVEISKKRQLILLVEDSITTRTQEKRILEGAGFEVVAAVDGEDAYGKLGSRPFDAVVSDIQMPRMDGLSLTEKIRQEAKYKELPIILVTALASDEDRKRGIEVGANAYITKPSFDQKIFVETIKRLV